MRFTNLSAGGVRVNGDSEEASSPSANSVPMRRVPQSSCRGPESTEHTGRSHTVCLRTILVPTTGMRHAGFECRGQGGPNPRRSHTARNWNNYTPRNGIGNHNRSFCSEYSRVRNKYASKCSIILHFDGSGCCPGFSGEPSMTGPGRAPSVSMRRR